ncbi:ankyrin [Daldinia sp. FL1419]|nr:ankyrin [Daldinia sp. FL1419]
MDTTSSVIAILQLSLNVMRYIHDVKDGGKERSDLTGEVLSIYEILLGMKDDFDSNELEDDNAWAGPIKPLFEHGGTIDQVKTVLEELTAKIVLSRGTLDAIGKRLKWPFEKSEAKRLLDRLRSSKDTISVALNRAHLKVGLETRANIQHINHALRTAELESALKWISTLDYRASQRESQRQRLAGTGAWFLNTPQVRGWSECRTTAVWCHGLPGVGKTVLASAVFEQLQRQYLEENVAILIAYCSFDDENTHSTSNIISSFIRQIVEKRGELPNSIKSMYAERSQDHAQPRPDFGQLVNVLSSEIGKFEKTFIIVDGLDEIPNDTQKIELLQTLESLSPLPQLMVTSRPVSSISTWFKDLSNKNKYRITEEPQEDDLPRHHCDNCHKCDEPVETDVRQSSSDGSAVVESIQDIPLIPDDQRWRMEAAYQCEQCGRNVCVDCYENFDVCFGCSKGKTCFKWTWPGSITISAHPRDIATFITWKIQNSQVLSTLIENTRGKVNDLPATIATRVRKEAHGIFLLAKFHMNALDEQTTAREIMVTLGKLPSNMKDIYDNVFKRIGNLRWAKKLKKLITIVATARRLLPTEALAHAIAVSPGDEDVDPYDLSNIRHLTSMCAGLIEIDHAGFVRLAHETVGFYIAQNGLEMGNDGHGILTEICLTYLQLKPFSSGICTGPDHKILIDKRRQAYPFLTYAATNWGHHARQTKNPKLAELVNDFLKRQAYIAAAAQIMWVDDMETSSGLDAEVGVHGLHVASYFGLPDAVSELLSTGVDADVEDCLQTTPLMYATQEGHPDIVRILLQAGAHPGRICQRNRTVLHRACLRPTSQHIDIIKQIVLSDKDVSINAFDQNYDSRTALMHTILAGCKESVKLLLTRNDIDVGLQRPTKLRHNALVIAVKCGYREIVETLLDDGRAPIESMISSGHTALSIAATEGYPSIVELLLDRGADPNARDAYGGTPLMRAIDLNRLDIVRILIQRGVDYNCKDSLGRGMLHACAINKRGVIMRYLLENLDLDLNVQGNGGETPLHDAVGTNSVAVTKVLLRYGARTDIQDAMGKTPLFRARDLRRDRLLSILKKAREKEPKLAEGGNSDCSEDAQRPTRADTLSIEYKIPIHAAVRHYSPEEFSRYLSDLGPQVDEAINQIDSEDMKTPMHLAAEFGRADNMRLLIDRGAKIGLKDRWGSTPLHLAAVWSQLETMEVLLQKGSEVDVRDIMGRTPLNMATSQAAKADGAFLLLRHNATIQSPEKGSLLPFLNYAIDCNELDIVKILVEGGVPWKVRDRGLLTPYQRAKRAGHQEIAQYLYDKTVGEKNAKDTGGPGENIRGGLGGAGYLGSGNASPGEARDGQRGELKDTPELEEVAIKEASFTVSRGRLLPLLSTFELTTRECGLVATIIVLLNFYCPPGAQTSAYLALGEDVRGARTKLEISSADPKLRLYVIDEKQAEESRRIVRVGSYGILRDSVNSIECMTESIF